MANLEEYVRPPITVTVQMTRKINTGNYESLDIQIGVVDVQQPGENHKQAVERVFNFVTRRIQEKEEIVRRELAAAEAGGGY